MALLLSVLLFFTDCMLFNSSRQISSKFRTTCTCYLPPVFRNYVVFGSTRSSSITGCIVALLARHLPPDLQLPALPWSRAHCLLLTVWFQHPIAVLLLLLWTNCPPLTRWPPRLPQPFPEKRCPLLVEQDKGHIPLMLTATCWALRHQTRCVIRSVCIVLWTMWASSITPNRLIYYSQNIRTSAWCSPSFNICTKHAWFSGFGRTSPFVHYSLRYLNRCVI